MLNRITKRQKLLAVFTIALILRGAFAILGWTTSVLEAYDDSIAVVYHRSAYLVAFGYGYEQTLPDSKAYFALDTAINQINAGETFSKNIPSEGRFNTSHYPPGYPLIGAALYNLSQIPIAYIYQILGILLDLLTIYFLYKLVKRYAHEKIAFLSIIIYTLSPQAISLSVCMTPDSMMPLLVVTLCYYFSLYVTSKQIRYIIILGVINGIGGYLRSDFILVPFIFTLLMLYRWRYFKLFEILKYNVSIAVITITILTPWALSNRQQYGEFNPTSTSLGATLVTGLSILPNQWNLGPTDYDRFREAQAQGYDSPFEHEANNYFKSKFSEYVNENPGYYLLTCAYRTVYFIFAPHSWGFERNKYNKSFSQLRNEGAILDSISYIFITYWPQLISSLISLLAFFCLIIYLYKHKLQEITLIIISVFICVWGSHVLIHMTPVYIMSVFPLQCFLFADYIYSIQLKRNSD